MVADDDDGEEGKLIRIPNDCKKFVDGFLWVNAGPDEIKASADLVSLPSISASTHISRFCLIVKRNFIYFSGNCFVGEKRKMRHSSSELHQLNASSVQWMVSSFVGIMWTNCDVISLREPRKFLLWSRAEIHTGGEALGVRVSMWREVKGEESEAFLRFLLSRSAFPPRIVCL